jgi:subtilisin family serine protease
MATNYRNYYPVLAVAFAPLGTNFLTQPTGFYAAHGVQSFGSTTNFNLDRVNELGQINVYENIEGIPNVDITVEKVIDGNYLLQHLASPTPLGASSLNGRYNNSRATVLAAIYNQGQNAASGTPLSVAEMSGMYVSSININIPVDGNMTESVTLVGNNKVWYTGALPTGLYTAATKFNNADCQ